LIRSQVELLRNFTTIIILATKHHFLHCKAIKIFSTYLAPTVKIEKGDLI